MGEKWFSWNALDYLTLVEWVKVPWFQRYQGTETGYLQTLRGLPSRTLIETGAGSGRILHDLAPRVRRLIAVELADNMLYALRTHAKAYSNVIPVRGDYTRLDVLLREGSLLGKTDNPLVVSLQNSLGTTKGDKWKAVAEFRKVAEPRGGDVVVSVFNAEALQDYGLLLYKELEGMVGQVDTKKTDINAGIFASKNGYVSQWFTQKLRDSLEEHLGGDLLAKISSRQFTILHITYAGKEIK